ncbi:small subunit ribosomal protein S3e [Enteropsectra breve]|nr:small subunit ribosomal protein S3e [Enteropsectra breve]
MAVEKNDSPILKEYIHRGLVYAELNELFSKLFQKECYAGLDLKLNQTPIKVGIKILNPAEFIGENKFRVKQLQNMVAQRLTVPSSNVDIILEKIAEKSLEPAVHAEQLRLAFLENKPYKRVINSIIRNVKSANGQGVMVKVAGKLKGQRAKSTKFFSGLLIQSGQPAKDYIKTSFTEAKCKQGVIGITVSVMLPHDPEGIKGPSTILPDKIIVLEPKAYN